MGRTSKARSLSDRIKSNRVVALLVLLGTTVIGVAAFSDAARNLFGLLHEAAAPRVTGRWITPVLTDPYDTATRFHLVMELRDSGGGVSGSLTYFDDTSGTHEDPLPVQDGKVVGGVVSFRVAWMNADDQKTYSDFYQGRMSGDAMVFETWNDADGGGAIQKFTATRQAR